MTQPSRFIWYELLTSELDSALAFYGAVMGWTAQESGMPGLDYRILSAPDGALGGAMTAPAGMPPCWLG